MKKIKQPALTFLIFSLLTTVPAFADRQPTATCPDIRGVPTDSHVIDFNVNRLTAGEARGQLTPLSGEQRLSDKYLHGNYAEMFAEAAGGAHYGLGERPEQDPFATGWWRVSKPEIDQLRSGLRERLFQAIAAQSGGDPRLSTVSWNDVRFTHSKWLTLNGKQVLEYHLHFPTGVLDLIVTARLLIPEEVLLSGQKAPAVIYQHFHGGLQNVGTNEIYNNWDYAGLGAPAAALTSRGFIVIAADVHGFNRRRLFDIYRDGTSPEARIVQARNRELPDIQDELSDTEHLARSGMSRYGIRSHEDYLLYRLIRSHPLVRADAIGTMGMSMGGVRANTLGALAGTGIKVVIANGTFPRFYLATSPDSYRIGSHRNTHTLLNQFSAWQLDTEHLVFLASETNYLAQMGLQDPSSPGWQSLFDMVNEVRFASPGKEVRTDIQGGGHSFTFNNLTDAYGLLERKLKTP